jgi:hypothetical protein
MGQSNQQLLTQVLTVICLGWLAIFALKTIGFIAPEGTFAVRVWLVHEIQWCSICCQVGGLSNTERGSGECPDTSCRCDARAHLVT